MLYPYRPTVNLSRYSGKCLSAFIEKYMLKFHKVSRFSTLFHFYRRINSLRNFD